MYSSRDKGTTTTRSSSSLTKHGLSTDASSLPFQLPSKLGATTSNGAASNAGRIGRMDMFCKAKVKWFQVSTSHRGPFSNVYWSVYLCFSLIPACTVQPRSESTAPTPLAKRQKSAVNASPMGERLAADSVEVLVSPIGSRQSGSRVSFRFSAGFSDAVKRPVCVSDFL